MTPQVIPGPLPLPSPRSEGPAQMPSWGRGVWEGTCCRGSSLAPNTKSSSCLVFRPGMEEGRLCSGAETGKAHRGKCA